MATIEKWTRHPTTGNPRWRDPDGRYLGRSRDELLNTYAHLWPNDEDRIVAAIDAGLAGEVKSRPVPLHDWWNSTGLSKFAR